MCIGRASAARLVLPPDGGGWALHQVLNAKVAYCQGISYIAAMFLIQQGVSEEEAFWMLR